MQHGAGSPGLTRQVELIMEGSSPEEAFTLAQQKGVSQISLIQ